MVSATSSSPSIQYGIVVRVRLSGITILPEAGVWRTVMDQAARSGFEQTDTTLWA